MHEVDSQDEVVKLEGVPKSSVGAPLPMVVSGEHTTILTYYVENTPEILEKLTVRTTEGEPVAVVRFNHCLAHFLGVPDETTLHLHPLSSRGLSAHGAYLVENSSWLRKLTQEAHTFHSLNLKHFVFTFQDSTFECIAEKLDFWLHQGPIRSVVPHMLRLLEHKKD